MESNEKRNQRLGWLRSILKFALLSLNLRQSSASSSLSITSCSKQKCLQKYYFGVFSLCFILRLLSVFAGFLSQKILIFICSINSHHFAAGILVLTKATTLCQWTVPPQGSAWRRRNRSSSAKPAFRRRWA